MSTGGFDERDVAPCSSGTYSSFQAQSDGHIPHRGTRRQTEPLGAAVALFPVAAADHARPGRGEVRDAEGGERRHPQGLCDDGVREGHRAAVGE